MRKDAPREAGHLDAGGGVMLSGYRSAGSVMAPAGFKHPRVWKRGEPLESPEGSSSEDVATQQDRHKVSERTPAPDFPDSTRCNSSQNTGR